MGLVVRAISSLCHRQIVANMSMLSAPEIRDTQTATCSEVLEFIADSAPYQADGLKSPMKSIIIPKS